MTKKFLKLKYAIEFFGRSQDRQIDLPRSFSRNCLTVTLQSLRKFFAVLVELQKSAIIFLSLWLKQVVRLELLHGACTLQRLFVEIGLCQSKYLWRLIRIQFER